MIMPGGEIASGQFLEVVPNRRIVFTWGWEGDNHPVPPGSSTVEIDLVPEAAGTRLRLTHRGLARPFIDHHHQGWQQYKPCQYCHCPDSVATWERDSHRLC